MADLNPAFAVQGGKPLPIAFGYVNGSGVAPITYTDTSNNTYSFNILFDGECDGYDEIAITATDHLWTMIGGQLPAQIGSVYFLDVDKIVQTHFHSGRWTPIGWPTEASSIGQEQGVDEYFSVIPTVTPPQTFSGMCYVAVQNPSAAGSRFRGQYTPDAVQIYGVFRGARCRYFDDAGNVIGYGFTTNPTWHMVELLLRLKFKRQQPQIAGLTAAEKACFNWPAVVAHAQRNDIVNSATGMPMFMFNGVFAAQATLASMLETILRCCQSYLDDQDGRIAFYGHDAANSLFTLKANHCFPGTFQVAKKDLTKLPNVFVPKYRDLGVAALVEVVNVTVNNTGNSEGSSSIPSGQWQAYFDTNGVNPFVASDILFYGDGSNAVLNGDWIVSTNIDPTVTEPEIWCTSSINTDETGTGGYIGTQDSRFQQRAPTTVQHRTHQLLSGYVAPGIDPVPNIVPVEYDMANMTYDQANRIMQYECNSSLGNDGAGWIAPMTGSVRVRLEAVDLATGNAFCRMRPGEQLGMFTVDDTLSPEFAGQYFIDPAGGGIKVIPPSAEEPMGALKVNFRSYNPNAYPTTSYPVDDTLLTIASAKLPLLGTSQQLGGGVEGVCWVIEATPAMSVDPDGTASLAIPNLTLQLLGGTEFISYPAASWTEIPMSTLVTLYVVDTAGTGIGATFEFIASGTTATPAAGWYPVLMATFTSAGFTTGNTGPDGSSGIASGSSSSGGGGNPPNQSSGG